MAVLGQGLPFLGRGLRSTWQRPVRVPCKGDRGVSVGEWKEILHCCHRTESCLVIALVYVEVCVILSLHFEFLQMSDGVTSEFVTLREVKIGALWGLCAGWFVYEACDVQLPDGKLCQLGISAWKEQRANPNTPTKKNSRPCTTHTCSAV